MNAERLIEAQIYDFPSGLLKAIKNKEKWELVTVSTDPHPNGQSDYEVRYQGECVIRFSRWNGYGFGGSAVYPTMKFSHYELLKNVYSSRINIWRVL